jgi:hypothetical protein
MLSIFFCLSSLLASEAKEAKDGKRERDHKRDVDIDRLYKKIKNYHFDRDNKEERGNKRDANVDRMYGNIREYYINSGISASPGNSGSVVLIGSSLNKTKDFEGDIKILGELQNTGPSDVSFVRITYTFKDASGLVLDTDYTYIYGSSKRLVASNIVTDTVLSPDECGGFQLYTNVPYDQVASMYYSISFENYETSPMGAVIGKYGNLNEQEDYSGELKVLGELQNTGAVIAYFIKFVVIPKDVNGQVLDIDYGCCRTLRAGNNALRMPSAGRSARSASQPANSPDKICS